VTRASVTRVDDGELLWAPGPDRVAQANITIFAGWLRRTRGLDLDGYDDLWRWSVTDLDGFWRAIWDFNDIIASAPPSRVLGDRAMPGAEWFPGARLNYAEHVFRNARTGEVALYYQSEGAPLRAMTWDELAARTRLLAARMRADGVRPGDRVASAMPNTPDTVIAMLATASLGGVWASCSPDYGVRGVVDRFRQLEPRLVFFTSEYIYGGKRHDRSAVIEDIARQLPGDPRIIVDPGQISGQAPAEHDFHQAAFGDPVWVLFSSGTTGPPKALTQSHGGILLEQLKLQRLQMDQRLGDVMFFYTTTGWMMWNFLVSSLLLGVKPVLYDGSPAYPGPEALWETAAKARVTFFGASPAYLDGIASRGVVPRDVADLSALRSMMLAGSPVTARTATWVYENVKRDLYLHVGSGGTDVCSGFTGGAPVLPVYAGEHQRRNLGVAAQAWNDRGEPVEGETGEMVITQPMPSMPVFLWGDKDDQVYRDTYFDRFPGVWRQRDFFLINSRGGCFVSGRSDATLNSRGVRIGTAEIYAVVNEIPGVTDSLITDVELPDGSWRMPLFVVLDPDRTLDDTLTAEIRARLRNQYSPRHVPDDIVRVPAIPVTITGKKLEVPVRNILRGVPPDEAADPSAMASAESLDAFTEYARKLSGRSPS
jgi:acetoacetyl-CoA synthetase